MTKHSPNMIVELTFTTITDKHQSNMGRSLEQIPKRRKDLPSAWVA
jgi:hypothetical protein